VNTDLYCLKELHLTAGWQCSLHRHRIKDETFLVQSGEVEIELGSRRWLAHAGESIHIPPMTWHRFGSRNAAMLLEVSTHHSDEDVERLEMSRRLSER
jgi:quercetin dioxygenase-like cupin family protein